MNILSRAVCAAILIAMTVIVTGCGETFRQVATAEPVPAGNPSGTETEVMLNQCPSGILCTDESGTPTGSVITAINVSGDTNAGNKPVQNNVATVVGPVQVGAAFSMASPIAFDFTRASVFTANTSTPANVPTDSVTKLSLAASTAGFAANTTTLDLPAGAAPVGISFQYFGLSYPQEYVVNSGATPVCPAGGSLGVIDLTLTTLKTTVCLGAGADPVAAWIYRDVKKVFVLDFSQSKVYVVDVNPVDPATPKLTNNIVLPGGSGPFKVAQSNDGLFLYVLNANGTISIIDGQAEAVVGLPVVTNALTAAVPIDMTQDTNFNDTSANTQINHIWVLHADGIVSVFDGSNVAVSNTLRLVTSMATITAPQAAAGAFPTNIALLRDGTWAYVGIGNTDKIVAIDTVSGAMTPITVGTHRSISAKLTNNITPGAPISATVPVETTTPSVTSVAVSRQGNSSQLSKAYATTQTTTQYFCYDENVLPTDCANSNPWANGTPITALPPAVPFLVAGCTNLAGQNAMSCPNLYNGTSIVAAADISGGSGVLNTKINTLITTLPAPLAVATCDAGNPATGAYDLQKNCPDMVPVLALGRN